jgi:hypothetical protein
MLLPKAQVAALAYFQKLFSLVPGLRQQLLADIEGETQRLISLLRVATEFADEPETLSAFLARPGCIPASYDPGGAHHVEAGEALLWCLGTTLGQDFTPEARAAWMQLHALLRERMLRAAPRA